MCSQIAGRIAADARFLSVDALGRADADPMRQLRTASGSRCVQQNAPNWTRSRRQASSGWRYPIVLRRRGGRGEGGESQPWLHGRPPAFPLFRNRGQPPATVRLDVASASRRINSTANMAYLAMPECVSIITLSPRDIIFLWPAALPAPTVFFWLMARIGPAESADRFRLRLCSTPRSASSCAVSCAGRLCMYSSSARRSSSLRLRAQRLLDALALQGCGPAGTAGMQVCATSWRLPGRVHIDAACRYAPGERGRVCRRLAGRRYTCAAARAWVAGPWPDAPCLRSFRAAPTVLRSSRSHRRPQRLERRRLGLALAFLALGFGFGLGLALPLPLPSNSSSNSSRSSSASSSSSPTSSSAGISISSRLRVLALARPQHVGGNHVGQFAHHRDAFILGSSACLSRPRRSSSASASTSA